MPGGRRRVAVDAQELQQKLRTTLGLRVGEHTARYVLAQIASGKATSFSILANDARTGRPVYPKVSAADLRADAQPTLFS
jgi:hypothetical protein